MPDRPNFEGHTPRECGEHRTVGPHRAWCYNCSEWCYPSDGCMGCRIPKLEAEIERLRHPAGNRPKGGIEQARRNFMRDDPELYHYIEARVAARELLRAGGDASGATDEYGAANRVWNLSGQWEKKWRDVLAAESATDPGVDHEDAGGHGERDGDDQEPERH